jgi:hypothetical protein
VSRPQPGRLFILLNPGLFLANGSPGEPFAFSWGGATMLREVVMALAKDVSENVLIEALARELHDRVKDRPEGEARIQHVLELGLAALIVQQRRTNELLEHIWHSARTEKEE